MSVFKSAYYCPFCNCAMVCTATNIVRHCKSRHGKTVKADDWTGCSWIIDNGIKEEVTHWQRLPASPEHEVQA